MDNAAPHVGLDERYSHGSSQAALSETVMYAADPTEVDDDPVPVKKARRSTSHLKAVPETLGQRNEINAIIHPVGGSSARIVELKLLRNPPSVKAVGSR